MKKLTPEIIKAAKSAKSPAELSDILGVNGIKVSLADADKYYAQLKARELSDEELSDIAGGDLCDDNYVTTFNFAINRRVEVINGKKCCGCGGVNGITKPSDKFVSSGSSARYLRVQCEKCNGSVILEYFRYCDVKFFD